MNLPNDFLEYMKKLLGDEFTDYMDSMNLPSNHGLRINRLKISEEEFNNISPYEINKIPFIDNGYIYNNKDNPAKDAYYHAGLYYLQEPSAMLPANRLPISEGDKVLDLCAAPGGKATELAGKLNGSGLLYANDISASRALALLKNLELCGAPNIYVTAETPENLSKKLPQFFDKVLCDVPCSGEGMFRKDSSLISSWLEKGPDYYQPIQRSIVDSAYEMLRPGGMLMYSTCTFNEKEDEENILYLLDKYNDLELVPIDWYEGFSKGILGLDKCVRIYPHKMNGEGHFLALLKKKESSTEQSIKKSDISEKTENSIIIRKLISSNNKNTTTNKKNFDNRKNKKISVKDNIDTINQEYVEYKLPSLLDNGYREGIRYIRTGLMMSDSQAYAMTLSKDKYKNCLSLSHDDIRVNKYLKGETIFLNNDEYVDEGNCLILVDKYPLGFAKCDKNGKLKNLYNKGWRMV